MLLAVHKVHTFLNTFQPFTTNGFCFVLITYNANNRKKTRLLSLGSSLIRVHVAFMVKVGICTTYIIYTRLTKYIQSQHAN